MRVIRVGLVGYGMYGADVVAGSLWDLHRNGLAPYLDRIGLDDWCPAYQDVRVRTVAIGTRSPDSGTRAKGDFVNNAGDAPEVFSGEEPWVDMLEAADLDVLVVATPDNLHYEPIMAALEAGVHVVAEKPLCLSAEEAREIVGLSESKGLIVGVDMHKRYDPDHIRIFRDLVRHMGSPIHARGVLEEPLEVSTVTFKWAEESDPFSYVGIHWVDLFCHYLQLRPSALYATGQKRLLLDEYGIDAFDATQVTVVHECGTAVTYDNNWITPPDFEGPVNQESELVMSRGKVESDSQYRGLRYWIETGGSRTSNTHFFRRVRRPDGSSCHLGYGKDSLVDCLERVARVRLHGASAADLAGTYPDARSQLLPCAIVDAARAVMRRNHQRLTDGQAPTVTAAFDGHAYRLVGDEG
jgi:predicted dehydrogenase